MYLVIEVFVSLLKLTSLITGHSVVECCVKDATCLRWGPTIPNAKELSIRGFLVEGRRARNYRVTVTERVICVVIAAS